MYKKWWRYKKTYETLWKDFVMTYESNLVGTNVKIKKSLGVKSKNIIWDISIEIIELNHNKTNKYLGINEANGINQTMD